MDLTRYKYIVGYGVGQYYDYIRAQLPKSFQMDYLCDARFKEIGDWYNGIKVISPEKLKEMKDTAVVVFSGNARNYNSISKMLTNMKLTYCHVNELFALNIKVTGHDLRKIESGLYEDINGNKVFFSRDIEESITIHFMGKNNEVHIGKQVRTEALKILCGNHAKCFIGSGTEIEECQIHVTDGIVRIGQECLISYKVNIRNHDIHHIFDKETGKRINYSGNIEIGNHVWIGYGAMLLGSANIGDNSVIGAMAVTSSKFPGEVVIAGNPAKVIREGVLWSKDNTNFYQREFLNECMAREAMKYI